MPRGRKGVRNDSFSSAGHESSAEISQGAGSGVEGGGEVLDGDREVVGGGLGQLGCRDLVGPQGGNQLRRHPDRVYPASYPVLGVDVIRVVTGAGLPGGAQRGRGVVQTTGPQDV